MDTIEYLSYQAFVSYDNDAETFYGRVINARDVISFRGVSVSELKENMKEAIDDYLALCEEMGKEPEKPYSGKFNVRLDPDLHKLLAITAAKNGVSLNSLIEDTLEKQMEAVA